MAESRLIGSYPVIGIRPTIDGRRGVLKVRESLEDQTMNMAKAAKNCLRKILNIQTVSLLRLLLPILPSAEWLRLLLALISLKKRV